ncbi:MAG: pilus assembly protein PilM [Planctomycetota bacterium]
MSGPSPADEIQAIGTPAKQTGEISCGACGESNPAESQFCAGCGHALYEPCGECNKPVLLSQAFCGACGSDLDARFKKRKAILEARIADAVIATKEKEFERAQALLALVTREKDYRLKETVANAVIAAEKINAIATQESASASDQIAAAQEAFERAEHQRVVELLGNLSPKLLTDDAASQLKRSREHLARFGQAQSSLQEAFQKRDWSSAGVILDQLLELQPDDQSVAKLATKVGKKLISKATALTEKHKYSSAASRLDCVPENARDDDYQALCQRVQRMQWLAEQFSQEPFATPTLGRLSQFWVQQSGGDPKAKAMLDQISTKIRGPKSSPRDLYAPLSEFRVSSFGGDIGFLGSPQCVDVSAADEQTEKTFRSLPGQFNVAIGMALQGLGQGRIKEDFAPKKGLLKRLGRKKSPSCWGFDIGSSGIKAVCLQTTPEGKTQLIQCYRHAFEMPLGRHTSESEYDEVIRNAVTEFLSQHDVTGSDVWVSFPGRELVSRFVKLPPVADKQVKPLFDKEVESRIPLSRDEVALVSWVAGAPEDELAVIGRPAFASAARKQFVERYLENLALAGLEVEGLQAAPIALINFAMIEFADSLTCELSESRDDDGELKLPAIVLFDCGAEMTTAILVSDHSCWFWSFEYGGGDFTRLISRSTKTTQTEAETLKRNPAKLSAPETQLESVHHKMEEMRARFRKTFSDLMEDHEELDVQQTWCFGGGAMTLGWIKRTLCEHE